MNIEELRTELMKMKKENPEKSKVLTSIFSLVQLIAKEDGNRSVTESDIVSAAKKELKMGHQSKDSGAPFNPFVFEVCESFLPKVMTESETRIAVETIISTLDEKTVKMMGKVMSQLKETYGSALDAQLTSKIVKECLS
jgi:uncharacterized protein YqeY